MELIGLLGKMGAGKDYVAHNYLFPLGYYPISFAWDVKVDLIARGDATYEEVFVTKPLHVRHLMQVRATEEGRDIYGQDIWVRATESWIRIVNENWGIDKFVLPDVRFVNELEWIQSNGGRVFRVTSDTERRQTDEFAASHRSETELDGYPIDKLDGIIYNTDGAVPLDIQIQNLLGDIT